MLFMWFVTRSKNRKQLVRSCYSSQAAVIRKYLYWKTNKTNGNWKIRRVFKKIKQILNVMNNFVDSIENPDEIDIHKVDEIISNIKKLKFKKKTIKKNYQIKK